MMALPVEPDGSPYVWIWWKSISTGELTAKRSLRLDMKMTMVERMARALAVARERAGGPPYEGWDVIHGQTSARRLRELLFDEARSAIEAMREPTEAMVEAAVATGHIEGGQVDMRDNAPVILAAMIDAALKEGMDMADCTFKDCTVQTHHPEPAAREIERLRTALTAAEAELVNLQPHIPTCCTGKEGFIDSHVDAALSAIRAALKEG